MRALLIAIWAIWLPLACVGPATAADWGIHGPPPPGWHGEGVIKIPESTKRKPGEPPGTNHTNTEIFMPVAPRGKPPAATAPDSGKSK